MHLFRKVHLSPSFQSCQSSKKLLTNKLFYCRTIFQILMTIQMIDKLSNYTYFQIHYIFTASYIILSSYLITVLFYFSFPWRVYLQVYIPNILSEGMILSEQNRLLPSAASQQLRQHILHKTVGLVYFIILHPTDNVGGKKREGLMLTILRT